MSLGIVLQVAADAITRWLYPHLDAGHRLIDLIADPQQHRDFLTAWMDLITSADNMMPLDKVCYVRLPRQLCPDTLPQTWRAKG